MEAPIDGEFPFFAGAIGNYRNDADPEHAFLKLDPQARTIRTTFRGFHTRYRIILDSSHLSM